VVSLNDPDKPRYVLLAQLLRDKIDDGTYPPGSRIPSETTLSQEYELARMTVRKAIDLLTTERRLYIVRGVGTYVAEPPYEPATPWPPPPSSR
jgi:GntR family transcriptional regulator